MAYEGENPEYFYPKVDSEELESLRTYLSTLKTDTLEILSAVFLEHDDNPFYKNAVQSLGQTTVLHGLVWVEGLGNDD